MPLNITNRTPPPPPKPAPKRLVIGDKEPGEDKVTAADLGGTPWELAKPKTKALFDMPPLADALLNKGQLGDIQALRDELAKHTYDLSYVIWFHRWKQVAQASVDVVTAILKDDRPAMVECLREYWKIVERKKNYLKQGV